MPLGVPFFKIKKGADISSVPLFSTFIKNKGKLWPIILVLQIN